MPRTKCWQVDAFADRPFQGNPAAVCWLEHEVSDPWMQAVAAEMNLSETAFVARVDRAYQLRWFTPQIEVRLCGHATLATAHVLWTEGFHPLDQPIRFTTQSGVLTCQRQGDLIHMDFPSTPAAAAAAPDGLLNALGVSAIDVGKTQFDYLVVLDSAAQVRALTPDFGMLKNVATRGTIVTSLSDQPQFDFISRFFAPAVGIDEDPVTGSAHCCLGPYWAGVLGKTAMTAHQASARGGRLTVRLDGQRVILGGHAVTVLRGDWLH